MCGCTRRLRKGGEYYTHRVLNADLVEHAKCCLSFLETLVLFQLCHGHMTKDTMLSPRIHIHVPERGNLGTRLG